MDRGGKSLQPMCHYQKPSHGGDLGLALLVDHFSGFWGQVASAASTSVPLLCRSSFAATIWRWLTRPILECSIWWPVGWARAISAFSTIPDVMLYSMIAVDVWVSAGFNMVILLAGLKNIPRVIITRLHVLDGATKLQEIVFVTLPMIKPVMIFVITL
ncbi:sugar ABC transporter permease [Ochrobactrum cytisi]|nr:sugar ABC transporter permease [Brucella cytisi]